tara:strand:- start:176 stop:391 length:216 start_codon:yes stop_codon:yes gene_type:complete
MLIQINGKELEIETKQPRPRSCEHSYRPINITLSRTDIKRLDALKKRTNCSRSALLRCAISALEIAIKESK